MAMITTASAQGATFTTTHNFCRVTCDLNEPPVRPNVGISGMLASEIWLGLRVYDILCIISGDFQAKNRAFRLSQAKAWYHDQLDVFPAHYLYYSGTKFIVTIDDEKKCNINKFTLWTIKFTQITLGPSKITFASSDLHHPLVSPGNENKSILSAFISTLYPGSIGVT